MNQFSITIVFFSFLDSPLFQRDEGDVQNRLLVIQCDSGHLNGDLIACARYRVYDERVNALNKNKIQNRDGVTHVLFIINLPHQVSGSSFVGFQGDPWISAHIDDLRPTSSDTIEPLHAIETSISKLFIGEYIHDIAPLLDVTHEQIPRLLSESDSEEEEGPTQEMLLQDGGGEADVEDEGSESEDDVEEYQMEPELWARSSSPESPPIDHVEQSESLEQLAEFPGQTSVPFEPTTFGPQQQQVFQNQEDGESPTDLATTQTNEMAVIDIEEDEMEFPSADTPQDSLVQNTEPVVTTYQENPTYFESVGDGGYQAGLSPQIHEPVETDVIEPTALPFMDESVTHSQAVLLVEPEVPETLMLADVNTESTSNQEIYPTPLVIQKSAKRPPPSGQCRRFYTCIQAAASRLEDSTKDRSTQRVTRLTKLIQRYPDHLSN